MISLLQILSEIKMTGKVTPEQALELFRKVYNKFNEPSSISKVDYDFHKLYQKYIHKKGKLENIIREMDQKTLYSFYSELLQFKQKYNL